MTGIKIRPAKKQARGFIVSPVPRPAEFELSARREAGQTNTERKAARRKSRKPEPVIDE